MDMNVNFFLIIGFIFLNLSFSNVESSECLLKIKNILTTESEIHLFNNNRRALEYFFSASIFKCEDSFYGNTLYTHDAIVFIHEAAHLEDIGASQISNEKEITEIKFNLYTVNNEHIGDFKSHKNLPKIKDVIIPYLKKEKPEFLKEPSIYESMHSTYIGDYDSMAANTIQGMATELSAYTHGSIIQNKTLPFLIHPIKSEGDFIPNIFFESSQLDGLMYFIYNFNLYLRLLKKDNSTQWKEFYTPYNKKYLNKLLSPSLETLKKLDHCSIMKTYENINFYIKELLQDDLDILKDILGEKQVKALTCLNN